MRAGACYGRPGGGDHAGAHTHTGTGGGLPGILPNSALYDGTAAQQVEAAGATAALLT